MDCSSQSYPAHTKGQNGLRDRVRVIQNHGVEHKTRAHVYTHAVSETAEDIADANNVINSYPIDWRLLRWDSLSPAEVGLVEMAYQVVVTCIDPPDMDHLHLHAHTSIRSHNVISKNG